MKFTGGSSCLIHVSVWIYLLAKGLKERAEEAGWKKIIVHEEASSFAGFEVSSCLLVPTSCIGRDKLAPACHFYVAKDSEDLYSKSLRGLFSETKSPSQLSYSS